MYSLFLSFEILELETFYQKNLHFFSNNEIIVILAFNLLEKILPLNSIFSRHSN
jgi:hypothetical protein